MKNTGLIVMLVLLVALMGFWKYFFLTYSWHQKMTVEVEVGGQIYSGSSVVAISVKGHPEMPLSTSVRSLDMQGEAVVVELPKQQYLFAVLTYNAFLASKVFKDKMDGALSESGERWAKVISELRETGEVVPKDYPLLVTFTDIDNPKTVQKVDANNLADTFGPGFNLKRITLKITDEPVTEGKIQQVLRWWNSEEPLEGPYWDWKHPEFSYDNRLLKRYFKEK